MIKSIVIGCFIFLFLYGVYVFVQYLKNGKDEMSEDDNTAS